MSSILKALKKIEGRKVDTSLPVWSFGAGDLEAADRYIRRSRRRQRVLWLLIVLCVVALAGKFYHGSWPAADKDGPAATTAPGTAPPEKSDMTAAPVTRITVEKAPAKNATTTEPPPKTAPQALATAPPAENDGSEASAPKAASPPAPEPVEAAPAKKASTPPPAETFATPPADNDGLTLMALVWSEQPESRFVVINGVILRQGGSIENSTVVRIEGDYVVMRTGGITWQLK